MKKLIIGMLLVLLLVVPIACSAPSEAPPPMPAPAPVPEPAPPPQGLFGSKGVVVTQAPPPVVIQYGDVSPIDERMIVRTGEISLVVEDVLIVRDKIAQMATESGGYVVSSRISGEQEEMRGTISIRVPDEQFEPTLTELRDLAVRVKSESTSSQDVTEEYIDLEARLKNAEATERQYLALLDKAIDVEDILGIYERLTQVRSEIEQIKARMQFLERTSSMSLITARLEPETTAKPLARAGWNGIEVLKSAVRGLVIAAQTIAAIALWLIVFIPIWGTILGIILWRLRKRKRAGQD